MEGDGRAEEVIAEGENLVGSREEEEKEEARPEESARDADRAVLKAARDCILAICSEDAPCYRYCRPLRSFPPPERKLFCALLSLLSHKNTTSAIAANSRVLRYLVHNMVRRGADGVYRAKKFVRFPFVFLRDFAQRERERER